MKKTIVTFAVIVNIFILLPVAVNAESNMSQINRQRKAIGRSLVEMQSTNWPSLLQYYTADIEYHDPIVTIEGIDMMSEFLARLFLNSPDLITTIEDEICINDIYAATWTMEGSFSSVPYNAKGITVMKFARKSKKVYYQKDYYTEGDIMSSIPELAPVIDGFRTFYRCAVDPNFVCPFGPATADAAAEDMVAGTEQPWPLNGNGQMDEMAGPRSDNSRLNRQRKKVGRAIVEINSANWPSLLPYYADDIIYQDPIVTIEGVDMMAQFLGRLFATSPDLITTVEDEICINGIYMATWTMDGLFGGVPITAKGMSVVKFRPNETQAYYARDYYTEGDIMINIPELAPAVEGFRAFYRCAVDPTFPCPY
jgi:hypothetical protein